MPFKIATWNVNSLKVRLPHVLEWLEAVKPDVLALQETKQQDADFPVDAIKAAGYEVVFSGQKTYNGVAILSRKPMLDVVTDIAGLEDPQRRVLGVTIGDMRIINLYIPNGESIVSAKYGYKLNWLEKLTAVLQEEIRKYPNLIILGDFNIAPDDRDVHDPIAWMDQVLCSVPEREAFQGLLKLGFSDCFRLQEQAEKSFSWWDYRMNAFKRGRGMRIDLILSSPALTSKCIQCIIDETPRTWERPSDHTPVIAEFVA